MDAMPLDFVAHFVDGLFTAPALRVGCRKRTCGKWALHHVLRDVFLSKYRARKNGLQNVISTTQAGLGRLV